MVKRVIILISLLIFITSKNIKAEGESSYLEVKVEVSPSISSVNIKIKSDEAKYIDYSIFDDGFVNIENVKIQNYLFEDITKAKEYETAFVRIDKKFTFFFKNDKKEYNINFDMEGLERNFKKSKGIVFSFLKNTKMRFKRVEITYIFDSKNLLNTAKIYNFGNNCDIIKKNDAVSFIAKDVDYGNSFINLIDIRDTSCKVISYEDIYMDDAKFRALEDVVNYDDESYFVFILKAGFPVFIFLIFLIAALRAENNKVFKKRKLNSKSIKENIDMEYDIKEYFYLLNRGSLCDYIGLSNLLRYEIENNLENEYIVMYKELIYNKKMCEKAAMDEILKVIYDSSRVNMALKGYIFENKGLFKRTVISHKGKRFIKDIQAYKNFIVNKECKNLEDNKILILLS